MRQGRALIVCAALLSGMAGGCGTMRTTNTQRTATEQLLVSDAIDRSVQGVNFSPLEGKSVYFDDRHLARVVDSSYLISSLRQHLLASGAVLKDDRKAAEYVVESRAGAVGTDNHDLLFGIPATKLPQVAMLAGLPPAIPEIAIAKRREQRGVAKIAVFAYRRENGESVWQSGIVANESTANDSWFLGAGPFKRGTIYEGMSFAGSKISMKHDDAHAGATRKVVKVGEAAVFGPLSTPIPQQALAQQAPQEEKEEQPVVAYETPVEPPANPPNADRYAPSANRKTSMSVASGPAVLPPPRTAPLLKPEATLRR